MGRAVAVIWHASFCVAAGVLFFFFVLPRTPEMLGDTPHTLGTVLRTTTGALIGLAALPVVFTLLRTRAPELAVPRLALNLRVASIALHVLAAALIIGAAISEIWLTLSSAGRWLFGVYGAAAAISLLAMSAFYLAFVAEMAPPPPKPAKPAKQTGRADDAEAKDDDAETADAEDTPQPGTEPDTEQDADDTADGADTLQNQRPTGKRPLLGRRGQTRGRVAIED